MLELLHRDRASLLQEAEAFQQPPHQAWGSNLGQDLSSRAYCALSVQVCSGDAFGPLVNAYSISLPAWQGTWSGQVCSETTVHLLDTVLCGQLWPTRALPLLLHTYPITWLLHTLKLWSKVLFSSWTGGMLTSVVAAGGCRPPEWSR